MPSEKDNYDVLGEIQGIVNQTGQLRPAKSILRNLETAAVISKFVKPRERALFRPSEPGSEVGTVNTGIEQISRTIMSRVEDNENIFRLFPDIELAVQIIVSSILSPKDMVKSELIYRAKDCRLPAALVAKMVKTVRTEVEKVYGLQDEAPTILRDALFRTGSHVKVVLPESAVDQLINQRSTITTESIFSPDVFQGKSSSNLVHIGLLGNPHDEKQKRVLAVESSFHAQSRANYNPALWTGKPLDSEFFDVNALKNIIGESVEVADNYNFLKMPSLLEAVNKQQIERLTGSSLSRRVTKFATESYHQFEAKEKKKPSVGEVSSMLYKSGNSNYTPFVNVPTPLNLKRKSVGRPLVLTWPSEAAIPIHVPGDVTNHIGYFVPVDVDGNPVSVNSVTFDSGQGLSSMMQSDRSGASVSSLLTEKARKNLGNDTFVPTIDHATDLYADIIENDLLERLVKGAYGKNVQVGRNNEIYRIMLARTLQSQFTRLIYVPINYVTYFAFNHHRNGVGKSYLDDLSNITSLRAMVLFSKVMAKVKSSITTTLVTVTLDPRDSDPTKTIEIAKNLVAKSHQQSFPHGLNRVVDLTDWMQRAGLQFAITGHPKIPETSLTYESKNIQHTEPDDGLDELFRHQTYMHFGLSPETVDSAAKADFATTIEQNSILFARRILLLSNKFSKDLTNYTQKLVSNDEAILAELAANVEEHRGEIEAAMTDEEKEIYGNDPTGLTDFVIQMFVENFEVDLPKPDSTRNVSQKTAIDAYEEIVDKGLAYIFSAEVLPQEFGGASSEYVEAVKAAWKATLMRKWMADNNYAPELFDITNRTDEGRPMTNLLEGAEAYTEGVMLNIVSFINKMKASKDAAEKDLQKLNPGDSSGDTSSSSGDSGSSDEGGFGDDGFGGGGDDGFGGGEDNPFDNPEAGPAGEENPEGGENPEGEGEPSSEIQSGNPFDAA